VNFREGEMSYLIYDDQERSLSKCHAALSRAWALPPLFHADYRSANPRPPGWALHAAGRPPPLFSALLAASCRLLRRQLESGEVGDGGKENENPAATLPSASDSSSAKRAGAPEVAAASEMSQIFEAAGVAVTGPSLRAVEELLAENAKRHRAWSEGAVADGAVADAAAGDAKRRRASSDGAGLDADAAAGDVDEEGCRTM
jgi:hypothetical protein